MTLRRILAAYLALGTLADVAAIVGIAGTAYSAYNQYQNSGRGGGGGGGNVPGAMTYVPEHQGEVDTDWQTVMQHLMSDYGGARDALLPFLMSAFSGAREELPGVQGRYRDVANNLIGQGSTLFGAGDRLRGAGDTIWNAALDPQNAMHDRTQQRIVDASRAATSARGIGMGGEAAGLENQAVSNFNIDWDYGALQRLLEGGKGMAGLYNEGGRNTQAGAALQTGATDLNTRAMGLPFDLASLFSSGMNSGIYGPAGGLAGTFGNYLGLGQSGASNAFNQQSQFGQGLAGLAGQLGNFGNTGAYSWLTNYFGGTPGTGGGAGAGGSGSGEFDFGGGG